MPPVPPAPLPRIAHDGLPRLLVWSGVVACVTGFVAHRMWASLPWSRSAELVAIAALVALPAWALVRLRGLRWASALALAWTGALLLQSGPLPVLAVLILLAGTLALGSLLVEARSPALAFVMGAALLAGMTGWLLPLPIHHAFVHLPVLVALVAWRRRAVRTYAAGLRRRWVDAVDAAPRPAAWAIVALGMASTGAWLPTLQHDDLAYHLGLPWQLMQHGRYALDPTHQVWALAPWAGDVLHGLAQVLARVEARGALNAAWLVAAAALLWRLSALLGLAPAQRWWTLLLFGSLPLLPVLLGGMQTETPAIAATLALAVLAFSRTPSRRDVHAFAALAGFLFALKLVHPAAAIGLLLVGSWRLRGIMRAHPRDLPLAVALFLLVGGSSYAWAMFVAGNPVLPLLNGQFQSPFYPPVDFRDARWQGAGAALPWMLTFDTSRYLEAWDGGFGFVLVALAGALLAALLRPGLRLAALCAIVAVAVPLSALPYARYAMPGLVLMLPVAVGATWQAAGPRVAGAVLLGLALLNVAFMPNAHWLPHTGAAKRALLAGGRDAPLLERYAPERSVHARIRALRPSAIVLDLSGATHAEFAGAGRTATWYAPRLHAAATAADRDRSGAAWAAVLRSQGITDVVLRPSALAPARAAGLRRSGANRALTVDDVEWWTIPSRDAR